MEPAPPAAAPPAVPPPPAPAHSISGPLEQAIARTKLVLFRPFDLGRWFVIGFTAFLALLQSGGGAPSFNFPNFSGMDEEFGGGSPWTFVNQAIAWMEANLALLLLIGGACLVFGVAIALVLAWLRTRGDFMFLDNVARNRAEVVAPWEEFGGLAHSLFLVRAALVGVGVVLMLGVLGAAWALLWEDLKAQRGEPLLWKGLTLFGALIPVWLGLALFVFFLDKVAMPLMYARRCTAREAMGEGWRRVRAHFGLFLLFLLAYIGLAMASGIIAFIACCCTCCIALLPYLGTVILLPVHVFFLAFAAYFVGQFDPDRPVIPAGELPAVPPSPAPPWTSPPAPAPPAAL